MGSFNRVEFEEGLAQHIGTSTYWKHFIPNVKYTDGARFVAQKCSAYWMLDLIASYQTTKFATQNEFQSWKFTKNGDSGTMVCTDGNDTVLVTQKIKLTDFPLNEMTLFCAGKVIYHPNEH